MWLLDDIFSGRLTTWRENKRPSFCIVHGTANCKYLNLGGFSAVKAILMTFTAASAVMN